MKIYVASSWRNPIQPEVVRLLREFGYEVYDFRHPKDGDDGFSWREIDSDWENWTPEGFRANLAHPTAERGFKNDLDGMEWADAFVLVLPCGRSAHLEAGWAIGHGKPTIVFLADGEPELMYKLTPHICITIHEVVATLRSLKGE